jgi:WD40 repeat protein
MRRSRYLISRFTLRHLPAGVSRIAVVAALAIIGCQQPPEEASTAVISTALLANGATCTANDQCSSEVCSGGVCVASPDLAVTSITGVPAQVSAQQLVATSWTVRNQGAASAHGTTVPCCTPTDHGSNQYNNIWFDRFFLSTDAALSADDVFIGEFARPDNFTLAAGASYTANASIHVPSVAAGSYYLILVTDGYGNRVPESDDTNNTIAVPVTVGQADLVVSTLTGVPAQASAQQLLPVSWTVTNQATAGAASGSLVPCCTPTDHGSNQYNNIWFDRFFLSTDATLSTDDTFIAEYARPDNFTLAAGASYTMNASIHVPSVAAGSFYLILVTDGYGNRVPESNDTNNTIAIPVTVGQADLVVAALTGVPAQVSSQQLLPVSWTVTNQATAGAASGSLVPCCTPTDHGSNQYNNIWFDRFFLSADATLSTDDTFIGEYARPDNFTLAAGASYTANASIHVPSVAAGSYYLILVTDGYGNRVPESNDTNNTFSVPITVGQSDLVVSSLTGVPGQAAAQQILPVSWTVTNQSATGAASGSLVPCCTPTDHGSNQYNNIWFDRFFLSTDATLSTDDTFIGEYPRPDNFTLAAGGSYTASASIHVPSVAAGSYYLILITDGYGNRVPESNDTNNTIAVPIAVGQADLVVSALTGVPAQVSSQQLLPVSWTVTNQTTFGAASGSLVPCCTPTDHGSNQYNNIWFDRFFLSTDATLSTDDTFIGEYPRPDNFTLAAGASYTASASIHVPSVAAGSYYLILVTDGYGNRVPESNESNNTIAVPITVGQADLVVSALTGVPAQVSSQQLLPVSWTVTNQTTFGAASGSLVPCCTPTDHGSNQYNNIWFDRFFLSTDATLSTDDTFIAEYARPDNFTLAAGASYTANASIHVPSVAAGSYYLILVTDGYGNRVPESNESNNTFSVPITVGQADLVVSALTGVPGQAAAQQILPVSWTVTNQSATGAASGSLVPCCTPTDHGSNQYNNIWFDRFFLSTDATLSTDDTFIGEYPRPDNFTLAAGGSYTGSASIHVPSVAAGSYYLILVTDGYGNRVPESNESNNTIAVPIAVGQADLVVSALTGVPAQASAQQLLPVSWTVKNQATTGAASGSLVPCCTPTDHGSNQYNNIWFDRFFLSTDATLSTDDTFIGEYARPDNFTLAAGASYTANASIHVPSVAAGSYYLILITDGYGNRVPESDDTNNTIAVPVTVGQADLVVSALTGVPAQVSAQQLLPVSWTVTNQATTGAASGSLVPCCAPTDHGSNQYNNIWFDRFFLSTDATLSTDDTFIGEYARPDNFTLAAGASYTASASIHVPSAAAGSYYLILVTDAYGNRVPESNETNNTIAVPITVGQADLVATSLTGVPAQASAQQLLPVSWTVTNQATTGAASGSLVPCCNPTDHGSNQYNNIWFDRFFLSTDATLSADDAFIGEYARPDNFTLAAGASYTASASIHVPSVAPGSYYVILLTDAYGNRVPESNEANNTIAVPITVGQADLVATSLTGVPAQASERQLFPLSWTVTNQATSGAANGSLIPCCTPTDHGSHQYTNIWFDRFVLSTDATASADDTFVSEYARPDNFTLAAGASYTASANLQLPIVAPGNYFLILVSDGYGNRVPESNEANNTIAVPISVSTSVAPPPLAFLPVAAGTAKSMTSPTFSPDGALLAAAEGPRVTLWSTETWTLRGTVDVHTATVNSVGFAPLGDQIVTAALDGSVRRSDTATRQQVNALTQPVSGNNPAAFSPDGARLVSGSGNNVIIWDAITNTQIRQLVGHTGNVSSVSLSPDGTHAATGGADGRVIIWNVTAGTTIATINSGAVNAVVFSPDGTEVMAGLASGWIRFYRATDGAEIGSIYQGKAVVAARYSPKGTHVASCDGDWTFSFGHCNLFERGGLLRATFTVPDDERGHEFWTGVAFSADSTTLATSFKNDLVSDPNVGGIYLWPTGLPATPITASVPVAMATPNSFTVHPHGRYQFDFNLTANHPGVVIHLSGIASSDATYAGTGADRTAIELFGAHGTAPSAAAHDDTVALTSTNLAGDILVERAVSGTYSVLVQAPMLTGGSIAVTIRADYNDFHLSRAETQAAGNAGEVTIRIRGTGLDRTNVTARLVSSTRAVLDAVRIVDRGDTRLFATFDLVAAVPGAYDVEVERSDASILTLTNAVAITAGTGPALRYAIEGPPAVRRGRTYTFAVNWENTGDSDAVAPFVAVTAPSTNAFFSDGGTFKMNSRMWLGASDGWPGHIIPARTRGRAVFQANFTTTYALHVKVVSADDTPFNWAAIMAQVAPPDPATWNAAALKIGTSRAQVFDTLRRVAAFSSNGTDYNVLLRTALWLAEMGAFDQGGILSSTAGPRPSAGAAGSSSALVVEPSSLIKNVAPRAATQRGARLCRRLADAARVKGATARPAGVTLDSDGIRTSRAIVTKLAKTFCQEVAP